jgi:hypothetical protein
MPKKLGQKHRRYGLLENFCPEKYQYFHHQQNKYLYTSYPHVYSHSTITGTTNWRGQN